MIDTIMNTTTKLDPREEHFRVASPHPGLSLFLRYLGPAGGDDRYVLYVHGGTFPMSRCRKRATRLGSTTRSRSASATRRRRRTRPTTSRGPMWSRFVTSGRLPAR